MLPKDKLISSNDTPADQDRLRAQAELHLDQAHLTKISAISPENLLHELQVHQIELEMQNETLRESLNALEESRDRYADFYDFSPIGYLTLNREALITEINLTGAKFLGEMRRRLINHSFAPFVAPEDIDRWYRFFLSVINSDNSQSCEVKLLRRDGTGFYAQLNCLRLLKTTKQPEIRLVLSDISERKQLEADLHESEKRRHRLEQQEIVQTSLDGFWVVNSNSGQILEVNDRFCNIVGYSREEILSMGIQDLDVIEAPEETEARIKRIQEVGFDRFETRHRHKQGHLVDLEVCVTHSEANGGVNFAFFRDITERKQLEQLKQSILNSIVDEIAVLDPGGVIVAVNDPWRQFALENCTDFGVSILSTDVGANYLSACQISEGNITDGAGDAVKGIRAVMSGQLKNFSFEYPCHSPQKKRWFRMNVTPLGETTNNGVVIAHSDITERRLAEDAIRQSRDRLKTFIEQAPISIAMFDREMNYLAVSGLWSKEFSRGYVNLIGLNHYEVYPDMPDKWKLIHQQAMAGATLDDKDDLWIRSDGRKQWLSWSVQPWLNENNKIGGIIISTENITDTKRLEMEIAERRKEMEELQRHHVAAQTASAIAHEINQPLHAIVSFSEAALLMLEAKEPDFAEICEAIKESETQALRAGKSIRDLINFLNRKEFPSDSLDFNKEIMSAIEVAKTEHNLVFHPILYLAEDLPPVRANRTHLQKVLINLIQNGIDATEAVGVPQFCITVTVRTVKDQSVAHMTIRDNGPGIKKEDINRLFEPFFTTKAKGIGMGLAISRSLIEENGGQLWVDPEEGPGATFHLTLPFAI